MLRVNVFLKVTATTVIYTYRHIRSQHSALQISLAGGAQPADPRSGGSRPVSQRSARRAGPDLLTRRSAQAADQTLDAGNEQPLRNDAHHHEIGRAHV